MDLFGLGPIADLAKEILAMFPNAEQRAAAASKLQDLAAQIAAAQSATNTAEAASSSLFVAGWRPFIGWVCGLGFLYSIIQPALHLPAVDLNNVIAILGGMLGLGTMRTAEKIAGVPISRIKLR
jgi:hypothetical protein